MTRGGRPGRPGVDCVDIVELFSQQTILVVGDFVADEFVFGEISRVSREAPGVDFAPSRGANAAGRRRQCRKQSGGSRRAVYVRSAAVGDDAAENRFTNISSKRM